MWWMTLHNPLSLEIQSASLSCVNHEVLESAEMTKSRFE